MHDDINMTIQPIEVTWEELYQQFALIFESIDYKEFYDILHLRVYNFRLKKKARREIKGIVLALWHLSVQITFPLQSEFFFTNVLEELRKMKHITKEVEAIYIEYWEALKSKQNADFSPPAELLRNRLRLEKRNVYTVTLALYMRSVYDYICEYLIDISLEESA